MIQCQNIYFSFENQVIFHQMNIHLELGQLYYIIGENGSGKSTFFSLLAKVYSSYDGAILIQNVDLKKYSHQNLKKIISICWSSQTNTYLTVRELLEISEIDINSTNPWIEKFELQELLDLSLESLSEGIRQWIFIARSIMMDNPILLLDEPTAFLDKRRKLIFISILQELCLTKQYLIVINTHDERLMQQLPAPQYEIENYNLQAL